MNYHDKCSEVVKACVLSGRFNFILLEHNVQLKCTDSVITSLMSSTKIMFQANYKDHSQLTTGTSSHFPRSAVFMRVCGFINPPGTEGLSARRKHVTLCPLHLWLETQGNLYISPQFLQEAFWS